MASYNDTGLSEATSLTMVIERLKRYWIPIPPGIQDSALREIPALLALEKELLTNPELAGYDVEVYPELVSVLGVTPQKINSHDVRASFHFCQSQVMLMQNIFLGVRLNEYYAHPLNRGWINLFRRWATAPTFRRCWPIVRGTVSHAFIEFAERHLDLGDQA